MQSVAALLSTIVSIVVLFWLDRDRDLRISKDLLIPFLWILIGSSRPVTAWTTDLSQGSNYIDGSPIDRSILTLLLILGLVVLSRRKRACYEILSANPLVVLFFGYCFLSILWSDFPLVTFKRVIRGVGDLVMVLILVTHVLREGALRAVFTRLCFVFIPASVVLIKFFPEYGRSYTVSGVQMWTGVCSDKNALGAICMIFGSSLLWRMFPIGNPEGAKRRSFRQYLAKIPIMVMVLYLVWVIDSKTALICFLIASTMVMVPRFGPIFRKPALLTVLVSTIILGCYCVLFLGMGGGALETIGRNSTLTGRTAIWATVLPLATNPLLGAGYENFWMGERFATFARNLAVLNQAHNGYLEIYLNLGWVGLVLIGVLIATGYRNIMRGFRADPDASRLKLAFFAVCLVYNFTEAAFKMMSPVWIAFIWAILIIPKHWAAPLVSRARTTEEIGAAC